MTKIHNLEQLLDAASKVFGEKGYDATRLQDIAAEIGVLQGSLYYHVGSKAELFRMVRVRRFTSIVNRVSEIAADGSSGRERLQRAVDAHLRHIDRHVNEAPQWFASMLIRDRSEAEAIEDHALTSGYRSSWAQILTDGMSRGEMRDDLDVSLAVVSILGMLTWLPNWYQPGRRLTLEDVIAGQFDLIWRSVQR